MSKMRRCAFSLLVCALVAAGLALEAFAAPVLSPMELLSLKTTREAAVSPNGAWIAYTVSVPRGPGDEAGPAWSELWVVPARGGAPRPFIAGKVNASGARWSPDGARIAFLMARGEKAKTQVWAIPSDGGEAVQLTKAESNVSTFRFSPDGSRIAYVAATPQTKREKELDKKGYGFVFFEENLKDRNLYVVAATAGGPGGPAEQITKDCSVWGIEWSPDGTRIAAGISPKNLVDQEYMFQRIWIVEVAAKERKQLSSNPGKLGNFAWSPDGTRIAYNAATELKDHAESQAFVVAVATGDTKNLTEPDFRGHVNWVGWKDKDTVVYRAAEGTAMTVSVVKASGGKRTIVFDARVAGLALDGLSFTKDFKSFALTGSTPTSASDVYFWDGSSKTPKRLTTLNPVLAERALGEQSVARYKSRDGVDVEGILVRPVGYEAGKKYPLVVIVHGGPEGQYLNGWVSRYSEPAQVLAGKGYVTFLPNYRASTGYGLDFALAGYNDAAGKEFDDVADGIDYLVSTGIADAERVGLIGGSYGGYAAAWFASYYTKKVRATCMFVGISDLTSKRLTTDIPYEELYVHSGKKIEDMWQQSLERSPIYWAHQSRTAVLILGGAADTRVYPGQSIEFYRILKMNDHPAVRLVQYPGEGHGNARQPGRTDLLLRQLDWLDWYVKDLKPFDGPLPPLDISDRYGLKLEEGTAE